MQREDPPEKLARLISEPPQSIVPKQFLEDVKWSLQSDTVEERLSRLKLAEADNQSRLKREEAKEDFEREKERASLGATRRNQFILLLIALLIILSIAALCVYILVSGKFPADLEKWATVTLTSLVTAMIGTALGYAFGKGAAK